MGRFWIGIFLLVVFLFLGLWVSYSMDETHQMISETLDQAVTETLNGNLESGLSLAQQAHHSWQIHWRGTASVADHVPMDEIDGLFAQMYAFGKAGRRDEFAACCAELSSLVAAVGDAHSLTWWNLL